MSIRYIGLLVTMSIVPLHAMKRLTAEKKRSIVPQKKARQEACKNSLVEVFGLYKNIGYCELRDVTETNISPRIIPAGWWAPQVKLDCNGEKYGTVSSSPKTVSSSSKIVSFSSKGDKIITLLRGTYACIWNAHDGKLLSQCSIDLPASRHGRVFPKYREDTNELLFLNCYGAVRCWNIAQNCFRYITAPLGRVCHSVWSRDKKKVIIVYDTDRNRLTVVIDTATGSIEKELASDMAFYEQVGFIEDSHKAIVFLENVDKYQSDECVEYKKLPFQELLDEEGTQYCYYGKQNKLVATLVDLRMGKIIVNVFDVKTNNIERMICPCKGVSYPYVYIKDSIRLILEHHNYTDDNFVYDLNLYTNEIDIWDLESKQNIFTIKSGQLMFSFNQLNNEKNILLVRDFHRISLWDIRSQTLIGNVDNIRYLSSARLNAQGDKFVVITRDDTHVWGQSSLTFKQILLRKLLNLYWQASRPSLSINSPEKLLDVVVKKFHHPGRIATRRQVALPKFCLDRGELQEAWDSFSEQIQGIIWRSILCKIKRYGK